MQIAELGLEPDTHKALEDAGIWETDKLCLTADELLAINGITGEVLYEIVCALKSVGLGLMPHGAVSSEPNQAPSDSDCEVLRERIVEGRGLSEIGKPRRLNGDEVRALLLAEFGLFCKPAAWHESVAKRSEMRIERQIAFALQRGYGGVPLDDLVRLGAARPEMEGKFREVIRTMVAQKLLTIDQGVVRPTAILRVNGGAGTNLGRQRRSRHSGRARR